ncbi:MAG: hypothetical protein K2M22_11390 [Lachnospiraceae bacterium]|nr:hypothetical protein [Lachnospiraceae bacterium]MDE7178016.1 hypothetical protein [Lachnospiraceae bacterium]
MIKKKICLLLIEILLVTVSACACSTGQETDKTTESRSDAATGTVTPQSVTPDLNHNGIAEEICLTDIDDGAGQLLEIRENDKLIASEEGYFAHAGWKSLFLCTLDGEDYLLRYEPMMFQGVCTYSYTLSTLSLTDSTETVVQSSSIDFDINFGSPTHSDFDPEAIADFMDEINDLLSHSVQLLNTDSDLSDTFEKEGRLYDSLWWLDSWEPEFVRDENKSLTENLKDFQTSITAIQ